MRHLTLVFKNTVVEWRRRQTNNSGIVYGAIMHSAKRE